MTITQIQIDEKYTYQFDNATGHVQILRHGAPWLGQQPGGLLVKAVWISAANEIERLRERVAELEGATGTATEQPLDERYERMARFVNQHGWTCTDGAHEPGNYDACDDCRVAARTLVHEFIITDLRLPAAPAPQFDPRPLTNEFRRILDRRLRSWGTHASEAAISELATQLVLLTQPPLQHSAEHAGTHLATHSALPEATARAEAADRFPFDHVGQGPTVPPMPCACIDCFRIEQRQEAYVEGRLASLLERSDELPAPTEPPEEANDAN